MKTRIRIGHFVRSPKGLGQVMDVHEHWFHVLVGGNVWAFPRRQIIELNPNRETA